MAWCHQATSHYLSQWCPTLLYMALLCNNELILRHRMFIMTIRLGATRKDGCVTFGLSNSLCPSDTMWHHYLTSHWRIIIGSLRNTLQHNLKQNVRIFIKKMILNVACEIFSTFSSPTASTSLQIRTNVAARDKRSFKIHFSWHSHIVWVFILIKHGLALWRIMDFIGPGVKCITTGQ